MNQNKEEQNLPQGQLPKEKTSAFTAPCEQPEDEAPLPRETSLEKRKRYWHELSFYAAIIVLVLMINAWVVRLAVVQGGSMQPTLQQGDIVVVWQLGYTPKQGDIIITTNHTPLNSNLTKRVIATGGQQVRIDTEGVWVDGVYLQEDYIAEETFLSAPMEIVVPEDEVFLLGDNRNASSDSRIFGTIAEEEIRGRVLFRLWPFSRWGVPA